MSGGVLSRDAVDRDPSRPRLLVVDDDPLMRRSHARFFDRQHDLVFAATVAQARTVIATTAVCSGAILDVGLPDGDGMMVLETFRARWWLAPVLMLTGYCEPSFINRAQIFGAQYAVKPVDDENLRAFGARVIAFGESDAVEGVVSRLAEKYGLSATERRILGASAHGVAREDLRCVLDMSENTVKTHVRGLVRKCGVYHLHDVARLVWQDAAGRPT